MKSFVFSLILLLSPVWVVSQHQLRGKVIDTKTKEALAFVNIVVNHQRIGTSTGIDGKFSISSPQPIETLTLSYVGYQPLEIKSDGSKNLIIKMKKTSLALEEFKVLPGVNPAERIVNEVIKNRKKHNPEMSLNFKYETYNKMYFTAEIDSFSNRKPGKIIELDSTDLEDIKWLENHHILMMESVTERKYKLPDKDYEKVIASKVSGFQNPIFSLITTELQSFSFYNPTLNLLEKAYLNPISVNSVNKYLFLIEDTTFNGADTVFIISFRPRKGKNFDALKGLLYINTGGYALQNVIAEPMNPSEDISLKIQQKYKKIEGSWFPIQLNSNLIYKNKGLENYKILGIGKTYLRNIQINPELENKEFGYVATEIDPDAAKKDDEFWKKYREDTLSIVEQNTYHVLDSLGKAENFDKIFIGLEAALTGKIKWGPIHFDLDRIVSYNGYEGARLGLGVHTNEEVSKWFSIGGYGAYAFKDKEFKYGGDIDFKIDSEKDMSFNVSIIKDVAEPGVVEYYDYKPQLLSAAGNRLLFLNWMNNIDKVEARFKFRTLRYLKVYLFANQENVEVTNGYYFKKRLDATTIGQDQYYTFNQVGVELRYAFKEKVIKTLYSQFSKPTDYPIIYGKIEQGVKVLDGEYQYTRFTIRAEKKIRLKNLGKFGFYIESGLTNGRVPQPKLNSSLGILALNSFAINAENTFETMLPNEFFSSEYINFHFRHNFGSLLFRMKKFAPDIVITTSIGLGDLAYKGAHAGYDFKTMEKGYYESGLILSNIIKFNMGSYKLGLGAGGYYRYGAYQLPKAGDNFAVKLSLGYAL